MIGKCPTCKQEKKLYQCFIDGHRENTTQTLISYGCKDCLRTKIIKTFGEESAHKILEFITKTAKEKWNKANLVKKPNKKSLDAINELENGGGKQFTDFEKMVEDVLEDEKDKE